MLQKEKDNIMNLLDKKGEILSGIVKRLEYGNVIVDLNRSESIITKAELDT